MHHQLFDRADTPETVGVPTAAIVGFLDDIAKARACMHGFIVARGGRVAAEGYWAPFHAQSMHRMYSVSKSLVSLSVGLLIDAGDLSFDDRVARFFPDRLPAGGIAALHPWVASATVRDLLMMATPHSTTSYGVNDPDWVATFFAKQPSHPPGSIFAYDTAATVVLGSIVEALRGESFLDTMRAGFLDVIGFSPQAWCVKTPEGSAWGGSGVICTLRDIAKVGWVCMNDGRWGERQVLPEWYVREATSKQIDNSIGSGNVGYGYQIWRVAVNGFAFIGMGSQLVYCFPEKNLMFACIADTQGIGPTGTVIVDALYRHIVAGTPDCAPGQRLGTAPETALPAQTTPLQQRLDALHVLPQSGALNSGSADRIDGRCYQLQPNPMGIQWLRFHFGTDAGTLTYQNQTGEKCLEFGIGRVVETTFPETHYFGDQIGVPADRRYRCLASAAWVEDHKLNLQVYIIDNYFGTMFATFAFAGPAVAVWMTKTAEWFLDEYQGFAGGSCTDELLL